MTQILKKKKKKSRHQKSTNKERLGASWGSGFCQTSSIFVDNKHGSATLTISISSLGLKSKNPKPGRGSGCQTVPPPSFILVSVRSVEAALTDRNPVLDGNRAFPASLPGLSLIDAKRGVFSREGPRRTAALCRRPGRAVRRKSTNVEPAVLDNKRPDRCVVRDSASYVLTRGFIFLRLFIPV